MEELSAGFVESFHLKEAVSSVTTYFPIVEEKNNRLLSSNDINIKYYPYIEFDSSGRLIALINTAPNNNMLRDTAAIEALKANTYKKDSLVWRIDRFSYVWDESDRIKKRQYLLQQSIPYPAFDGSQIKLNSYSLFQRDPPSTAVTKEVVNMKYDYEFNKNGTIKMEKRSMFGLQVDKKYWRQQADSISNSFTTPTIYQTNYYYDRRNRLSKQDICFDRGSSTSYTAEYPFLDGYIGDNATIAYWYGDSSRLQQVTVSYPAINNYLVEDYTYEPGAGYISKVTRHNSNEVRNIRGNDIVYFYNAYGDLTEVYYFTPDPLMQQYCPKRQFYVYEYDDRNNWTTCKIYLEGTKDTSPNFVAERKIVYFQYQ